MLKNEIPNSDRKSERRLDEVHGKTMVDGKRYFFVSSNKYDFEWTVSVSGGTSRKYGHLQPRLCIPAVNNTVHTSRNKCHTMRVSLVGQRYDDRRNR